MPSLVLVAPGAWQGLPQEAAQVRVVPVKRMFAVLHLPRCLDVCENFGKHCVRIGMLLAASTGLSDHSCSITSPLCAAGPPLPATLYCCGIGSMSDRYFASGSGDVLPFLSKLESLAGSAVRAAGKVQADLIVVYTATGEALRTERVCVCVYRSQASAGT